MIDDPNYYAEDPLREGQPLIKTAVAEMIRLILKLLLSKKPDSGDIYGLYGGIGVGKSTVLANYCKYSPICPANEAPTILYLKSSPHKQASADLRQIAKLLSKQLYGTVDGDSLTSLETALLMSSYNIIVIDDAQYLNNYTLSMIRYLNAKTGCRFVLCGTPSLKGLLRGKENRDFWGHLSYETELPKMTQDELIGVVLPSLTYPLWKFNPQLKKDQKLGEQLWKLTGHSLHRVHLILEGASKDAVRQNAKQITKKHIDKAKTIVPKRLLTKEELEEKEEEEAGPYEQHSIRRHDQRNYTKPTNE